MLWLTLKQVLSMGCLKWGAATSVLLLALEVTRMSPAVRTLLQTSSCVADLTTAFMLSCLIQTANPDNL